MPNRTTISSTLVAGAGSTLLSACATIQPRYYSAGELARVANKCEVAASEVVQISPDPSLLYILTLNPSDRQLDCVERWANRRSMTMVFVESVEVVPEQTEPDAQTN